MTEIETLAVRAKDGATSEMRVFSAGESAPSVLIAPAMGVAARFYDRLCRALNARGISAATLEWRGYGTSSLRASRSCDWGYRELVTLDVPAAAAAARERFQRAPNALLGHSLGGQIGAIALAVDPSLTSSLLTVACCSIDYRGFPRPRGWATLAFTQGSLGLAAALGHYPGERVGFGGREAVGVIRDWAHQSRTGVYRMRGPGEDAESALARASLRAMLVSIEGDTYAPPKAVDALAEKLRNSKVERAHFNGGYARGSSAHFAWAKDPSALIERVAPFLLER